MTRIMTILLVFTAYLASAIAGRAEMSEVTIARQPSLGHLPLMIMQDRHLLEKKAAENGLKGLKVQYTTFAGGAAMNDALLSGSIQFAAGGVPPLLILWSKTANSSFAVKGVSAMNSMPLFLNTNKPSIKSIRDFKDDDKIALPAVKVSIQAILLQMEAEKLLGAAKRTSLDKLTVTMSHPDGMAALLSNSGVTAHFTAAPVQELELKAKGVHKILSSYDVTGGPTTFNVVWTSSRFKKDNPIIYRSFVEALDEAVKLINSDQDAAIKTYLKLGKDASDAALIRSILNEPGVTFTTKPEHVGTYIDFMEKTGAIKQKNVKWKDVFFDNVGSGS